MAVSFPEQPELVTSSEKLVFDSLETLSDSWHIYSNMQQHVTFYERISRGEVDFVLTHPYFGIVLIEVKGHGVFCNVECGLEEKKELKILIHKLKMPREFN